MAFKREGNDGSWLNSLKNRRVAELFAEDIPEGEAHLMKNGRFACLVCAHRPIFDTVLMLARHREGKKHAASVEQKLAEEEDLRQLRRKRQHEEWTRTGQIPASLLEEESTGAGNNTKALLGAAAYDPRCKKHKTHPNYRKPAVDLSSKTPQDAPPSSTMTSHLPGNRQLNSQTSWSQNQGEETGQSWKSYKLRDSKGDKVHSQNSYKGKRHNPVNPVTGRKMYDDGSTGKNKRKSAEMISDHRKELAAIAREEHVLGNIRPYQRKFPKTSDAKPFTDSDRVTDSARVQKSSSADMKQPCPEFIQEFSSGYIKDKLGNWVRDENAEFDSDDDSS